VGVERCYVDLDCLYAELLVYLVARFGVSVFASLLSDPNPVSISPQVRPDKPCINNGTGT
jgi:hypothetical protein